MEFIIPQFKQSISQNREYMKTISEEQIQNYNGSDENILANSIRNARSMLEKKQISGGSLSSSFTFNNPPQNQLRQSKRRQSCSSSSAAKAIKVLHERIAQLQAFNTQLTIQVSKNKKQMSLKTQETETYKEELQNEQILSANLNKKIQQRQKKIEELESMLKKTSHQNNKFENSYKKTENLLEECKNKSNELEKQLNEMNKRLDTYQKLIAKQIHELEEQKQKNRELLTKLKQIQEKMEKEKDNITFPAIIDSPQISNMTSDQIMLSSNRRHNSSNRNRSSTTINYQFQQPPSNTYMMPILQEKSAKKSKPRHYSSPIKINEQINQLKFKNKNLTHMLSESNKRNQQQMHHKKMLEKHIQQLIDLTNSIIDEVNLLPNNFAHKFKILIVKFRKVETQIYSISTQKRRRVVRQISRSGSRQRQSRDKSKTKRPLKMEDLNISEQYSCYSRSNSKQKRSAHRRSQIASSNSGKKRNLKLRKQKNELTDIQMYQNKSNLSQKQQATKKIKFNCKKIHQIEARLVEGLEHGGNTALLKMQLQKLYEQNEILQNTGSEKGV